MHWKIVWVLSLIFFGASPAEQAKKPGAWDAKSIVWQETEADGTKWSVLEGRSDVPGEAFTYAAFIPGGFHEFHSHATDGLRLCRGH